MSQSVATFPTSFKAKMASASESFDRRAAHRLDSLSAVQQNLLQGIVHKDASESIWFARQLEYIRPGVMDVIYPQLEGKSFVPIDSAVGAGVSNVTYRVMNKVGTAALVEDYSMDPPRADVFGSEFTQTIKPYGVMYGYNFQELQAAMFAGLALDTKKAMSARYAMELKIDQIIWYGDVAAGLTGLATQDSTLIVAASRALAFTVANGVKGTKLWRDKTPDEIVLDLHTFVNNIVNTSAGVYAPQTLILPLQAYSMINTRRMGDGSNDTILTFFKNTSQYITEVRSSYRLNSAQSANWSGSTGRCIAYDKSPERFTFILPVEFEQLAPQQVGYEYKTFCHARIGGIQNFHPQALSYMDSVVDNLDQ